MPNKALDTLCDMYLPLFFILPFPCNGGEVDLYLPRAALRATAHTYEV